ncbi:MAG TPA: SGNH/GDSL hydrolase family protein [Pirellulales bacterium]
MSVLSRNLMLCAASIMSCFIAAEILARILVYRQTPTGMIFADDIVYSYAPHAQVGDIVMNDIGCIGDDVKQPKRTDELRVLLLGESTSFSVQYVNSVRERLKQVLPERPVVVFSCGRPRYTSFVNRINFEKHLLQYHPDAIGLYMGINDNIYNSFPWLTDSPSIGFFDWKSGRQLLTWALFKHYLLEKHLWSRPGFGVNDLRSPGIVRTNLEQMIATAATKQIKVVLSTFAVALPTEDANLSTHVHDEEPIMEHFWGKVDSTLLGVTAHNATLAAVATARALPLVDVSSAIPHDGRYFVDICHLTDAGNRILGSKIADGVISSISQ